MKNLQAEIKRFGITIFDIQQILGCSEKTVRNKITGVSEFSINEAIKLRNSLFPGLRLEYLYNDETDNEAS